MKTGMQEETFEEFVSLQQKYGDSQALKSIALEHYTSVKR